MEKVFLCSSCRKCKISRRRFYVSNLRKKEVQAVSFDAKQHKVTGVASLEKVNSTPRNRNYKSTEIASLKTGEQESFLDCIIRWMLAMGFISFGALLGYKFGVNWSNYWTIPFGKIRFVFLMLDCLACIVLGISILREKDRNYLMSVFSALVSLAALVVTMFK